jgi:hypothetical protein
VANEFIKAEQIVEAAVLLLEREVVLGRLVWTQSSADFVGAKDDTITLRVPAVMAAKTRTMRGSDDLEAEDLTETAVPVALDTHVYQLLNITDEQLTLDIRNFAPQVLARQVRSVAEGIEDVIAGTISGVTWEADPVTFTEGDDEPFDVLVNAGKALNLLNVPRTERVFLCGASVEAALLKSDKLSKVNESGTSDALREATIARVAGFTVVGSNAIGEDEAYAFHRTAVAFGNVAPALPEGATMKARISSSDGSFALRYLRDYNPTNSTGPVDRSLVDAFVGAASVDDENTSSNHRGVEVQFTPEGS